MFYPRICQSALKDEDFFFFLKHHSHNMIPCRQLSSNSRVSSDSQAGSTSLQFSHERFPEVGLLELGSRKGCCACESPVFLSSLSGRSFAEETRLLCGWMSHRLTWIVCLRVSLCPPGWALLELTYLRGYRVLPVTLHGAGGVAVSTITVWFVCFFSFTFTVTLF